MGKKQAPSLRDVLPNKTHVNVTIPAATTTVAYTSLDTGIASMNKMGWLIERIDVGPRTMMDGIPNTAMGHRYQVCMGEQTDLLDRDDPQEIATLDAQFILSTNGAMNLVYPLTWVGPAILITDKVTAVIDGTDDIPPLQSIVFTFTLWWTWMPLSDRDYVDFFQQQGLR